jgi:hypothetical protein
MSLYGDSKLDRSDAKYAQYEREANEFLEKIIDEFSERSFTEEDVRDAFTELTNHPRARSTVGTLRNHMAAFNNLVDRDLIVEDDGEYRVSTAGFAISEEIHSVHF